MANRPYITAAQVRYSVLRRRAVKAQLEAEAKAARTRRTKPAGERSEQVSTTSAREA
jgi:hypothetical protein